MGVNTNLKLLIYKTHKVAFIVTDDGDIIFESMSAEHEEPDNEDADECPGRGELDNGILAET